MDAFVEPVFGERSLFEFIACFLPSQADMARLTLAQNAPAGGPSQIRITHDTQTRTGSCCRQKLGRTIMNACRRVSAYVPQCPVMDNRHHGSRVGMHHAKRLHGPCPAAQPLLASCRPDSDALRATPTFASLAASRSAA